MGFEIIGAEVFDVGRWNGLDFSNEDLDNIVEASEALADVHRVPLKLGHNKEQPVTDGQPALGWVTRLYRKGSKLVADFEGLPQVIYDAIKAKRYRTVSVELLKDAVHKARSYPWVVDAVALLGADQPAVNTLGDLDKLLAARSVFSNVGSRKTFNTFQGEREEVTIMPDEGKQKDDASTRAKFDRIEEQLNSLALDNAALKAENIQFKSENETLQGTVAKLTGDAAAKELASKRAEVAAVFDRAIKAGNLTPAQREHFTKLLKIDDDEALAALNVEEFTALIGAPKGTDMNSTTTHSEESDGEAFADADEELMHRANLYMEKHGEEDFGRAVDAVGRAHPKLVRRYVDITGS